MRWTAEKIERELAWLRERKGDTTLIEVKAARGGIPENLAETTCAFANMPEGGTILLGIDEHSNFDVVGVAKPAEIEAGIVAQARNAVSPSPSIETYTVKVSKKHVVVAEVAGLPITSRPATFKGRAFLRQADGDYKMNDAELRMVEVAKLHADQQMSHDTRTIRGTSVKDLDKDLVKQFLDWARTNISRLRNLEDDNDVLRMLQVIDADKQLTLSGLYGIGMLPQGPLPALSVTAAVRLPEGSSERTRNLEVMTGPVPDLLVSAMDWVQRNIDVAQQYGSNGHMRDVYELPMEAVREIIANALVHRDVGPFTVEAGKGIDIRLDKNRLVVSSPGGLKTLSTDQLVSAELSRVEVNPHLYRVARAVRDAEGNRIIEGEGGGIQQVLKVCEKAGLRAPTFIDTGVKFTAILWRGKVAQSVESEPKGKGARPSEAILKKLGRNVPVVYEALAGRGELGINDIAQRAGLSISQTRYALRPLVNEEFVIVQGGQGISGTVYSA